MVMYSPFDELIVYGAFMCLVAFITRTIYNFYCKKHFEECSFKWTFDKELFKEMFGFASGISLVAYLDFSATKVLISYLTSSMVLLSMQQEVLQHRFKQLL